MEEEEEVSDAWDSQAEEVSEEEEMDGWDSSLDEEEEEQVSEDEAIGEKPPASSGLSLSQRSKASTPSRSASPRANRRWDTTIGSPAAGKVKRQRRGYCSWRAHKSSIVNCLQHCRGNISFTRRYLLYHHGVAVPRNVLYYYRHLYSPYETLGEKV